MNTLAEFFVALMFYTGVIVLAMGSMFIGIWIYFSVMDLHKQKQIKRNWKENP